MTSNCSVLRKQVERILENHKLLEKFKRDEDFYAKFQNEKYLPLVVERHGEFVNITHYLERNGDLIPDPDMKMLIGSDGEWYPVAVQFSTGHYSQARFWIDEKEYVVPHEVRGQVRFSSVWAKNLRDQGF